MPKSNEYFFDANMTESERQQHLESLDSQSKKAAFIEQWRLDKTLESFFDEYTANSQANEITTDFKNYNSNKTAVLSKPPSPQDIHRKILWRSLASLAAAAIIIFSLSVLWLALSDGSSKVIQVTRMDKARHNFTLNSGVKVKVLDDTTYAISTDNSLKLISGHIQASVPPQAKGFIVETSNGIVRDISTKFSVKADKHKTEIFVLKGEVEVYFDKSSTKTIIKEHQAVALHKDKKSIEHIPFKKHVPVVGFEGSVNVISINLAINQRITGECGYIRAANWNNITSATNDIAMTNNLGAKTQTTLNTSHFKPFPTLEVPESKTNMQRLFKERLNKTVLPNDPELVKETLEISLKNIPYQKYDIIVYYWIGRKATDHMFDLQINDSQKFRIHRPTADSSDSENEYTQWRGVGRNLSGNMLISQNCSGSTATVRATLPDEKGTYRSWYICGMQIAER
ncbi:MAG: FecR domain-containing protein [Lentisphaeraceae bacterium]|nr:FecR domain-containing protein [Lentisphaeraceae bacterium]